MGISEKARSLYSGMPGGGFHFKADENGTLYVPPKAMPYELEGLFVRWAESQPSEYQDSLRHVCDGVVIGISTTGWESFLDWMLSVLRAAQD